MKKLFTYALLSGIATALLWSAPVAAQFAKPEDAIKYRQSVYTLIASHFSRLQPMVKGEVPYDPAQAKANVALLKALATLPRAAFAAGTEGGGARPEIWSDGEGFKKAQQKFEDNVDKLSVAVESGNLAKLRTAFSEVGASCKACHDSYRNKKK
jgi:adenylosuccinate lyase